MKILKLLLVYTSIIIFAGFTIYHIYNSLNKCSDDEISISHQPYLNFTNSIYSTIQKYYWKKLSDRELSRIYQKAFDESAFSINNGIKYCSTKLGILNRLNDTIESESLDGQLGMPAINDFVFDLNQYVVKHLYPDENISEIIKKETVDQRLNLAMNKIPEINAYKAIDVGKEAGSNEILLQCQKLSRSMMTQDQIKSCNTLADPVSKEIYDQTRGFSSLSTEVDNNIFYVKVYILSPTFIYELEQKLKKFFDDYSGYNDYYLIFDLRQSPGGYQNTLNYLLSQFFPIGEELYKVKSQISENPKSSIIYGLSFPNPLYQKFNKIIILVDEQTESASDMFAEVMKRNDSSIIIGVPTHGTNSAFKMNYPIEVSLSTSTSYQLWLVNEMMLKSDGQMIYHNGVIPDIDVNDIDWNERLKKEIPDNLFSDIKRLFQ